MIAMMVQKLTGARVLVLTSTKGLQNQYEKEWGEYGSYDIRGQNNYECLAVKSGGALERYHRSPSKVMVDRAPCHVGVWCPLKQRGGCEYYDAARNVGAESLVVTNYSYWMVIGAAMGRFDYLILDEADEADAEVRKSLHVDLSHAQLRNTIAMEPLSDKAPAADWADWSQEAHKKCVETINDYTKEIAENDSIDQYTIGLLKVLQSLEKTVAAIGRLEGDWLIAPSRIGNATTFDPIWPTPYCESMLYRGVERVIPMSATLTPMDLRIMGIDDPKTTEYVTYNSPFPVHNRPVYVVDFGEGARVRVDSRLKDYGWLVSLMDSAIAKRLDRKILIHSVSYKLTKEIMRLSRFRGLMVTHEASDEKPQALADFRRSVAGGPGSIMISPSMKVGESFPMDECEVVLIPKVPFLDMRDPIMKRREAENPDYGGHLMMKALQQSVGRHVRSLPDRGETIIFDDHARWAIPKFRRFATSSFMQAVTWVKRLPAPLPKL